MVLITNRFAKEIKRLNKKYPSLKNEFIDLIDELKSNPKLGVNLGSSCFKIRLSIVSKNRGKSSGCRVITYFYLQSSTIYLLTIYDKSERSGLKPQELREMLASLDLE